MIYFLFILGFVFLIKGADLLIDGATSLARRFHISDIVIGLTIVAFGTSTPELVVNVVASYAGNADIAIGNVLGSNIVNTFLAVGLAAIISSLSVRRNTVHKEIPLSFLAAVVMGILANDEVLDRLPTSDLTRIDGLVLLCFFVVFFSYILTIAKDKNEGVAVTTSSLPLTRSVIYVVLGLALLCFGAEWVVDGAVVFAQNFGLSEALIGLTIVAVGTSLPEIVTSAVSAWKGNDDIAIGNVVGSNIFNIFWILGVSALIRPLPFDPRINFDVGVNILAAALLFAFLYVRNRAHVLRRIHGVIFILLYVGYIVYLIKRG